MQQQLFKDVPLEERRQLLADNAYKIEQEDYLVRLTSEERAEHQEMLSRTQVSIIQTQREKKQNADQFNAELKKMQAANLELVETLKNNAKEVFGEVFLLADEESRLIGVYNERGELIRSRPMTSQELQKTIFPPLKKAE